MIATHKYIQKCLRVSTSLSAFSVPNPCLCFFPSTPCSCFFESFFLWCLWVVSHWCHNQDDLGTSSEGRKKKQKEKQLQQPKRISGNDEVMNVKRRNWRTGRQKKRPRDLQMYEQRGKKQKKTQRENYKSKVFTLYPPAPFSTPSYKKK